MNSISLCATWSGMGSRRSWPDPFAFRVSGRYASWVISPELSAVCSRACRQGGSLSYLLVGARGVEVVIGYFSGKWEAS